MADLTTSRSPRAGCPAAWQVFLDFDYDFCPTQLLGEPAVVAAQLLNFHTQGIDLRLRSTLLRCQPFQNSRLAFLTPFRQMRRVQTVSPKHSANLARLSCRICFRQNFLLVLCRVLASFGSS